MSKKIVRFNLAFDTTNAAFADDLVTLHGEIHRIFEHVLQRLDGAYLLNEVNIVRDVNGNAIGSFIVTTADHD